MLLAEFPDITTPNFVHCHTKHGVEHFITTRGPPVHARARRLPPEKLAAAKSEFDRMEAMGIIGAGPVVGQSGTEWKVAASTSRFPLHSSREYSLQRVNHLVSLGAQGSLQVLYMAHSLLYTYL